MNAERTNGLERVKKPEIPISRERVTSIERTKEIERVIRPDRTNVAERVTKSERTIHAERARGIKSTMLRK